MTKATIRHEGKSWFKTSGFNGLEPRVQELLKMLTFKRPARSKTELDFIGRYVASLPGAERDGFGNWWVVTDHVSPIMFSCHTDTVHKSEGMQKVLYGADMASVEKSSNCLGADCTVGVWIMRNMILANVPGTYIFHADEEIGGGGSQWIAKELPDLLSHIRFAIAFDRKDYNEIITYQAGDRCCSDEFAASLADVLHPLAYAASENGLFTDTANYVDIIGECTNIGVGYFRQHTRHEYQDVRFACALLDQLIAANWNLLTAQRMPGEREVELEYSPHLSYGAPQALIDYCRRYPADVADFLADNGFTIDEVERAGWGITSWRGSR